VRIGAFEIYAPLPELDEPCAFAIIRPWIDVSGVGTLVLRELESQFQTRQVATLARPGHFFDLTRYRPTVRIEGGIRNMTVPNVTVSCGHREGGHDIVLLDLLEPHALSEMFVDSVLKLLKALDVKKYVLIGSMADVVPHTRPLIVYGGAGGRGGLDDLRISGALSSDYEGPTTMAFFVNQKAPESGMDTIWLIVALPQYVGFDEDYLGKVRLMEILNLLYGIPIDRTDFEKALEQRRLIEQRLEGTPELRALIPRLEDIYDERLKSRGGEQLSVLTTDMEEILWKTTEKDFGKA
jgi:hypothetical protein